jgi:hypothetical protein
MAPDDRPVRNPGRLRRLNELLAPDRQRLPAHDPRHGQPFDRADGHEHQNEIPPEHDHQDNDEENEGQGVHYVDEPHHVVIDAPAQKPGGRPVKHADHQRHDRRHQPDRQRHAPAQHHANEHVAPVRVGAEDVALIDGGRADVRLHAEQGGHAQIVGRRAGNPVDIDVVELMRPGVGHDDRHDGDGGQHDHRGDGGLVGEQTPPRVLPQTAALNFADGCADAGHHSYLTLGSKSP